MKILQGKVGLLEVIISWTQPISVRIEDVYVIVGQNTSPPKVDEQETQKFLRQAKHDALINWELLAFPEKSEPQKGGYVAGLIEQLVDHINVKVCVFIGVVYWIYYLW